MIGVFDHPWLGGLFGDDEMDQLWSPVVQLESMRAFEKAWSEALGMAGIVDFETVKSAAHAISQMSFDTDRLREGTSRDGVVVPALVAQMRAAAGTAANAVHTGATSQDVIDTAAAIAMRNSMDLLLRRLAALEAALADLDARFGGERLLGRTRMQVATEITVHDRISSWQLPLMEHKERLTQLRPRVARVQIGGASGDRRTLADKADLVASHMAVALGLENPGRGWHAKRDGVAEFASCLSLITGTLGKIGQDIALMAQQGISEVSFSSGGGSSAMPHKQNPILAELLVTLARFNAVQVSAIHQAIIHEQERSGAAWMLEWMVLPQMAQAAARSLSAGQDLMARIVQMGSP